MPDGPRSQPSNEVLEAVQRDVEQGLSSFTPTEGFLLDNDINAKLAGGSASAVVWTYSGRLDQSFFGLPATGGTVVIRGITVFETDAKTFRRYVDWLDVAQQLGFDLSARWTEGAQ